MRSLKPVITITVLALCPLAAVAQSAPARMAPLPDISRRPEHAVARPLALKWDEAFRVFTVEVSNSAPQPAEVYGVQTTSGVYVVDFPATIPANGQAVFTLLYAARAGTNSSVDLLRVLTDRGEKVVEINHQREAAARLGATSLQWQVGGPAESKEVVLTVPAGAVPKSVRAGGEGNVAELRARSDGSYAIVITPASTARPRHFPVFVEFEQAIPGVTTVVLCSIVPAS